MAQTADARPEDFAYPSPEIVESPYEFYRILHAQRPVHRLPGSQTYLVTRYEEVAFAARHPELFSSKIKVGKGEGLDPNPYLQALAEEGNPVYPGINEIDPPAHTAYRRLAFASFTPGRLRAYETMIEEIVDMLIDGFAERGEVEFVREFANPLPMYVICDLLGFPRERLDDFKRWSDHFSEINVPMVLPERVPMLQQSTREFVSYMRGEIKGREERPTGDILSAIVNHPDRASLGFDVDELVSFGRILLIAGNETTAHMLSTSMLLLMQNPQVLAQVRTDESLTRRLFEEALRIESPVQWLQRICLVDTELGGVSIPKGSRVFMMWGAANRDETVFPDAGSFNLMRANLKDHMAFGFGIHFCLGAPLARMEGRIALRRLLARMENIRLAPGRNDFMHAPFPPLFRGLNHLHLDFDPV